jgi:hypothetical protein
MKQNLLLGLGLLALPAGAEVPQPEPDRMVRYFTQTIASQRFFPCLVRPPDFLRPSQFPSRRIQDLAAALVAPRRLGIIDALRGDGRPLNYRYARQQYAFTAAVYALTGGRFEVMEARNDADLAEVLVGNF